MDKLDIFALFVLGVLLVAFVVLFIVLARLPGKVARKRNHPQAEAIDVGGWLGLLLFGVLWPLALVWAFTKPLPFASGAGSGGEALDDLEERIAILERRVAWGEEAPK